MPFQSSVSIDQAAGVPGMLGSANPFSTTVAQRGEGVVPIRPGQFVWLQPDGRCLGTGVGVPDAFAILTHTGMILSATAEAGMEIPAGQPVTGAYDGDWFATSTNASALKQKVYAVLATGEIKTQAAGVVDPLLVETAFSVTYVSAPGTAGSAIIISKH